MSPTKASELEEDATKAVLRRIVNGLLNFKSIVCELCSAVYSRPSPFSAMYLFSCSTTEALGSFNVVFPSMSRFAPRGRLLCCKKTRKHASSHMHELTFINMTYRVHQPGNIYNYSKGHIL